MQVQIKIRTITARHFEQLPPLHNWDGTYPWDSKEIIGRSAHDGFILARDKSTGDLERVAPIAFIDVMIARAGAKLPDGSYVPPPHTKYVRAAQDLYDKIPQLFTE